MMTLSLIATGKHGTHKQGLLSPFKGSIVNHRVTLKLSKYTCCTFTMMDSTVLYGSLDDLPKSIADLDRG
jgi:hypothetical protein